jgi:type III pantothenate kinase
VNALYAAAAKLPKISIEKPSKAIGDNTVSAMKSGIYWGYVSMVEGMVKRITAELDCGARKPMVIATGGLSNLMAEGLEGLVDVVDEDLTLKGLKTIYNLHMSDAGNKQHKVMS